MKTTYVDIAISIRDITVTDDVNSVSYGTTRKQPICLRGETPQTLLDIIADIDTESLPDDLKRFLTALQEAVIEGGASRPV